MPRPISRFSIRNASGFSTRRGRSQRVKTLHSTDEKWPAPPLLQSWAGDWSISILTTVELRNQNIRKPRWG